MNKEKITLIINKIEEYELKGKFNNQEDFINWIKSLNEEQTNNFISLNLTKEEYHLLSNVLTNKNLLNCHDYNERIKALLTLKNSANDHPISCTFADEKFLKSPNWYEDIEILSRYENIDYAEEIIDNEAFINSPYHYEDLKLILEAKDVAKDENGEPLDDDDTVTKNLIEIATNSDSINSPYHQDDMKLISTAGSIALHKTCWYNGNPTLLANNPNSLNDTHHPEIMKLLLAKESKIITYCIYKIFTNEDVIKSEYYDDIKNIFSNIEDELTAIALYSYILSPTDINNEIFDEIDYKYNISKYIFKPIDSLYRESIYNFDKCESKMRNINPEHLKLISKQDGKLALYIADLLKNETFINSPYMKSDTDLLIDTYQKEKDKYTISYAGILEEDVFSNYYKMDRMIDLLTNETFANSIYHNEDLIKINKSQTKYEMYNLVTCAKNKYSTNSHIHEYDMEYIIKICGDNKEFTYQMEKFLYTEEGINNKKHIKFLEDLADGKEIKEDLFDSLTVDDIYKKIEIKEEQEETKTETNEKNNIFRRIKKYLNYPKNKK